MSEREKFPQRKAVALKYDPEKDGAPRVVASGRGETAERIIQTAKEHGIPLHTDPELAGALLSVEVGLEIPPELYRAVAEILAFIYRLDRDFKETLD
ncbi:EscU/YscU/HrcU family type III secretion system export apparatus switch protein [Thermosediminibacter oceani]|uniref:FlhB domain protein n=1 Tax=Thermosediminibacter oceani (strain ATCC BAA-1034 / DSM 16646 / JW/IW-1228P) TaxID=555079 RepID=D9RZ62_THEOJ|nr:EscU/YscU/HrcU family type III secretion system export apparatus switch protein [Thermosediminibacter oceani]ADL08616.1 FlhB domain protein [Thermosediminibacter oceani DSM 16646]